MLYDTCHCDFNFYAFENTYKELYFLHVPGRFSKLLSFYEAVVLSYSMCGSCISRIKSSGSLLELLVLGHCPRPTESETLSVRPNVVYLTIPKAREQHLCRNSYSVGSSTTKYFAVSIFGKGKVMLNDRGMWYNNKFCEMCIICLKCFSQPVNNWKLTKMKGKANSSCHTFPFRTVIHGDHKPVQGA